MVKRYLVLVLLPFLAGSGCRTMAALTNLDTSDGLRTFRAGRLYGRRKGFVTYTNPNMTYIATKPLAGCVCDE